MTLTLPEELLLLMLDDESGRLQERAAPSGDYALAGAVLAELTLAGRIVTDPDRLRLVDPTPTGDAVQDRALAAIAAAPAPADTRQWIETLAGDAETDRDALFARLVGRGILKPVDDRFLWVFPERRYPMVSETEEREVKARIMDVLFHDTAPSHRDALLIGLCRAAGLFPLLLSGQELDHLSARIDRVADPEEINRSLADAIREIYLQIARYAPMI
jgi:hypothetical protein